ncbi:TonB-dependent receptor plug domain-containing protein [Psychrobacter raelei]|uniref:TonB-dependent receptor plug domain-containing protein n=1 Tax=Psychrobacter raelei TaxID=2565531 RepID=UPI003F620587
MQYRYLSLMILVISHSSFAQDDMPHILPISDNDITHPEVVLPTITVKSAASPVSTHTVTIQDQHIDTHTLGEALEKVSGVHSGSFGPHSGSPIIRGLQGNRVSINEDGTNVNGLNAISPATNLLFDPVFSQQITVNKNNSVIESGGRAIGGSVEIDSGLISRQIEDKPQNLTLAIKDGTNAPHSQGIKANMNNEDNLSINLLYSAQRQGHYDIPGDSKAKVCQTDLVRSNEYGLGVNTVLADACQKHVEKTTIFNPKSRQYFYTDYVDPSTLEYTQTYYDYGLSPGDVYTNYGGYGTAENPQYEPDQPEYAERISKINDVTENYHNKLGNSHLDNRRLGISGSYFFDNGYVAAALDNKTSRYGLPGFSMSNLNYTQDYTANVPVQIDAEQTKYLLESQVDLTYDWLSQLNVNMAHIKERNEELLGDDVANHYDFDTYNATVVTQHQPSLGKLGVLSGKLGADLSYRDIRGRGEQRYLPDVDTQKQALFLKESLPLDYLTLGAGYRYEKVTHKIQDSDFSPSSKSPNDDKLLDTDFNLNSYELSAKLDVNDYLAFNLRYANSERAPEVNELYASQAHFSSMAHEEGNQTLDSEKVASTELSALINYQDIDIVATAYKHDFDGYYSLRPSGTTFLANRLPLKYWQQIDTKVSGFEIDASKRFDFDQYGDVTAHLFADLVKNKPKDGETNGEYLTNIPTDRYGIGLNWQNNSWESEINFVHYAKPKYLGKEINTEVALSSYNMMDVSIAKTINGWADSRVKLFANASNLLDEEARPHASPLRYIAPLPGRSINAGITVDF